MHDPVLRLPSDEDASGRDLGREELDLLEQAITSGHLSAVGGKMVARLERLFADRFGIDHATACSSGTAALHAAVAAVNPSPGEEIITSPLTGIGTVTAIAYQGAIPVFADVDPITCNITADTIAPRITPYTRAIVVNHLFGNPCAMGPILDLAHRHRLAVIEDCAHAFLATWEGHLAGTMGDIACFSFQQGHHMTTGEGGIVLTDDPHYARRAFLFVNEGWGAGDAAPDHYFLAPNYRMTELQGAVAIAQLEKLDGVVERRMRAASIMDDLLSDLSIAEPPRVTEEGTHVYWKYSLRMDPAPDGPDPHSFGLWLQERGIDCTRPIRKPAFETRVVRERVTFADSHWPWEGNHMAGRHPVLYRKEEFPGTAEALAGMLVLPWNEFYTTDHLRGISGLLHEGEQYFLNLGLRYA